MSAEANSLKMKGIFMLVTFVILLGVIFSKVFPGNMNGLDFMDELINKVSKGSSYFIDKEIKNSAKLVGKSFDIKITLKEDEKIKTPAAERAAQTAKMFELNGAEVAVNGAEIKIKGDIGNIIKASLMDADAMFKNDGKPVADKYGFSEKLVLLNWWNAFNAISKDLTKKEKFEDAKPFANMQKKAFEPAYNYYKVEIMKWQENLGLIIGALAFYVFYTVWYGFGLMYLFEGLGLKIGH